MFKSHNSSIQHTLDQHQVIPATVLLQYCVPWLCKLGIRRGHVCGVLGKHISRTWPQPIREPVVSKLWTVAHSLPTFPLHRMLFGLFPECHQGPLGKSVEIKCNGKNNPCFAGELTSLPSTNTYKHTHTHCICHGCYDLSLLHMPRELYHWQVVLGVPA